ncbi:uncharacterized protein LOC135386871 [Ornithodoros turicata]|uniref:uncharacterized protein LOC135386871 n=1 Tax=Ornithodoros turicata TaxID=34597 RepID=UPI003139DA6F
MYDTPEQQWEKCKKEHSDAEKSPGIHFNRPSTPFQLVMPGGIEKFQSIHFDMTLSEEMTTVSFEWRSTTRKMDLPLLEILIDQYKPGFLNYSMEDYDKHSCAVSDPNFKFTIGKRHIVKLFYDTKDSILVVMIDGAYGLFHTLENFQAGSLHDTVRITGHVSIDAVHVPYDTSLPLPLTIQLEPGNHDECLCEIRGKRRTNGSEQMTVTLGKRAISLPIHGKGDTEDVQVKVSRSARGYFDVSFNDKLVEALDVIASEATIDGHVDISWVETGTRVQGSASEVSDAKL